MVARGTYDVRLSVRRQTRAARRAAIERGRSFSRRDRSDGGYGVSPIALHDGAGQYRDAPRASALHVHIAVLLDDAKRPATARGPTAIATVGTRRRTLDLHRCKKIGMPADTTFPQGSLVSVDLAAARSDPQHLKPSLVFAPGPREMLDSVDQTSSRLLLTTYQNVRGREWVYTPAAGGGWTKSRLDLPDNSSVFVNDADRHGETAYLTTAGFLVPPDALAARFGNGRDFGREEVAAAVRRVERRGRAT